MPTTTMAQRPKRKRGGDQEPLLIVPPPQHPNQGEALLQPMWTSELQDLYNTMRQVEEELPLMERVDLQNAPGNRDGQNDFLQPPTPSTAMSRSPSCASTTNSVTRALKNVEMDDDRPSKKRAMRHGPLDKYTKARAAFIRKLGACDSCRGRKVKCNHYNLDRFQQKYEASKRPTIASQPAPMNLQFLPYTHPQTYVAGPYQPRFSEPVDLIGVGLDLPPLPFQYPQGTQEEDFDNILLATRSQQPAIPASNAAPLYNFGPPTRSLGTLFPPPPSTIATMPQEASPSPHRYVPIGRKVLSPGQEWECLWGINDGTESSVSSGEAEACNLRCNTLDHLYIHFSVEHAPYQNPNFMWRCLACNFNWMNPNVSCPNCSTLRSWQRWCWGYISSMPSLTSGSSIPLANQDGAPSKPSTGNNQAGYFSLAPNPNQYNTTRYMAGGQGTPMNGGGYQQYGVRSGNTPPGKSKDFQARLSHCVDPYGRIFHPTPSIRASYTKSSCSAYTKKIIFFNSVHASFYWLVSLTLLSLLYAENWFQPAGAPSWAVPALMAAHFFEAGRRHIPELSVACIVAGLTGTWLFKHVWFRLAGNGGQDGDISLVSSSYRSHLYGWQGPCQSAKYSNYKY
ncbi:hypothetical protein B0T24DRAFT_384580 [Lasiosphaeria ovina]|uniref:Uncharacterized protein n=1 Tax=Lasiosphaeria ovina TaxID=92902 RepID=A0AAE0N1Y8_9PEZI|nr:hypothetical protein B0T24DRAFT_384580 [Lasiosphaeria ovina]